MRSRCRSAASRSRYTDPDGGVVGRGDTSALRAGDNAVALPIRIERPRRWYPVGYGPQDLVHASAPRCSIDGTAGRTASTRTGLRTSSCVASKDAGARASRSSINGIPVFAKGANVIPFDMFPAAGHARPLRHVLQSARDANMNMLRNWGGGYYESDDVLRRRRRARPAGLAGLHVRRRHVPWPTRRFATTSLRRPRDRCARLRNHPSIVLWCGNNEVETAWKNWG